jgi:hypothetical protein
MLSFALGIWLFENHLVAHFGYNDLFRSISLRESHVASRLKTLKAAFEICGRNVFSCGC